MPNILFRLVEECKHNAMKRKPIFFLRMHFINILEFNKMSLGYSRDLRLCQNVF